jgi:transposase
MHDADIIDGLELKFNSLAGDLDERGRRLWHWAMALGYGIGLWHWAMALGYGGITAVSLATGLSDRTIRNGIKELQSDDPLPSNRQRRAGAGRKPLEDTREDLIDRLVEPTERGDPQSPLRWTSKSLTNLQGELLSQGFQVGRTKISKVLRSLGYSLQGNRKTREGTDHPDRNAQFEHIARRVRACRRGGRPAGWTSGGVDVRRCGRPAVSVDTKKKETLGKKANVGREYRPKGEPLEVDTHDFPDKELGKAIPYGV